MGRWVRGGKLPHASREETLPPQAFIILAVEYLLMSHAAAVKLYEDFTELDFDGAVDGDIPQPKTLDALGEIMHVVYVSNKWHKREGRTGESNEFIRYIHDFKKHRPMLCHDSKTKHYHIIGKVGVKPEGITDFKGKNSGNTGTKANYSIPKTLTFLGILEEIQYESFEDEEEYKVEFPRTAALCANPSGMKLFIAKMNR